LRLADFHYDLPEALIAREPAAERHGSRLLAIPRDGSPFRDHAFRELPQLLRPGDLLVVNDARVIKARLRGHKADTGGQLELLLDRPLAASPGESRWRCLGESSKGFRAGQRLVLAAGMRAEVVSVEENGFLQVRFPEIAGPLEMERYCERHGELPLPPYLARPAHSGDETRYQTVFAEAAKAGAVAAPTAGLHFSPWILGELESRGVGVARLTLFVGPGTFLPVRTERIEDHRMETERYEIPAALVDGVERARGRGGRVIAVGTTVVRALESSSDEQGRLRPGDGVADLFIAPGYRFRSIDGLLTNFHLPGSTLLMLVAAFGGRERILAAYAHAVTERYRFYSYGDCCLLL
jgi:S-adenosylmethionine:tRNA ribosyltransferase-isomerase